MQLYYVEFEDGTGVYTREDEYDDLARAMELLSIKYTAIVVTEPMYAIHWFDYIDDEWSVIWCTEDNFERNLEDVKDAEVEYYIVEYN